MHYVYFDGTSYWVGSEDEVIDSDTKIVFKSNNFDECSRKADEWNEEV